MAISTNPTIERLFVPFAVNGGWSRCLQAVGSESGFIGQ